MSRISSVDNKNYEQINRKFKSLQTARKIVYGVDKALIVGAGAVAAKSIAKNEKSVLTKYLTKGIDFAAGTLKKGFTAINKKGIADKAIKGLNKVISAPGKTKSLALVGIATAGLFLDNVRRNNIIKGAVEQANADAKVFQDVKQKCREITLPRAIRAAQKDTREKIAFGE